VGVQQAGCERIDHLCRQQAHEAGQDDDVRLPERDLFQQGVAPLLA
jgi:hypothetical protein